MIRLDVSLVLEENLRNGEGISRDRMGAALARAEAAHGRLLGKREAGEIGFPDLPFREREARDIARAASALSRRFSHLLVLGIGGSALGTKAVLEALPPPGRRRGARIAVADNGDPDGFFPLVRSLPMRRTGVVAGVCAGIDPFDQPGVEEGKRITRALMGEKGAEERRARLAAEDAARVPAEVEVGAPAGRGGRGRA